MSHKLIFLGLSLGRKEEKLGIRASSTCSIILENVEVGKDDILGKENDGFKVAMSALSECSHSNFPLLFKNGSVKISRAYSCD